MTRRFARRNSLKALTVLTAIGLVSVFDGGLTGVGSAATGGEADAPAAAGQTSSRTVANTCAFPAPIGSRPLSIASTATLPSTMTAGSSAKISGFSMTFTLPRDIAEALLPAAPPPSETPSDTPTATSETSPATPTSTAPAAPTAALAGGLTVNLELVQGDQRQAVPVPLTIGSTPLPATGDVVVTATGDVPEFVLKAGGVTEFAITAPTLALKSAAAEAANDGTPPSQISCTLDPGQNTVLGAVVVLPAPGDKTATDMVKAEDDPPPDDGPPVASLAIVKVTASATVVKLGAQMVSPAAPLIGGLVSINDAGNLVANGKVKIPSTTVTFLAFGFMPITATADFLPADPSAGMVPIRAEVIDGIGYSTVKVIGKLSNAKVNGVPLDVGPNCTTDPTMPISISVYGPYDPFIAGTLQTDPNAPDPAYRGFKLPSFENCGATEPLSKIFSGMSSGEGNKARVDTLNLLPCFEPNPMDCVQPAPPAEARHK